ncbi:MAG: DEAD/DEAH box helicase [Candidatus Bathyarchaeota archaeon]|nr:DEAD/DEAH box helicase [Candidatus Bathyarchaeota archaeon]MDH5788855.1 DEAD/DEAH box helicase [Candidatus Bathyarchaeota archaeon]
MQMKCFEDLPLSQEVMNSIEELGFSNLFPIQAQAIIPLLEGKDVIGQAQTGTGKTAAFGIPMVERLDSKNKRVQGLVLEPTRELAVQVAEHISRICKYAALKVLPIYGGTSIQRQIYALKNGVQIVVGTPGRIIDHLKRGTLDLESVKTVVIDEADRMLDMGFIDDIESILSKVPANRQTSLFSATIDQSVMNVCNRYMKKPEKILVSKDEIALTQISQYYTVVNPKEKFRVLCNILDENHIERAIIFCKTRVGTDMLAERLRAQGYDAKPLHGGFTQPQRDVVSSSFRKGKLKFLVATDVAARGLDIQGITHIINYDVPLHSLVYFHRIGRTARMGREGTAITLVGYGEIVELDRIRALTNTSIEELESEIQTSHGGSPETHKAVCTDCGNECEVPFKPDPSRPVYCRECWANRKSPIERLVFKS